MSKMANHVRCNMCPYRINLEKKQNVLDHIKNNHGLTSPFYVQCPIEECNLVFAKYATFRRHYYSIHNEKRKHQGIDPIVMPSFDENLLPLHEISKCGQIIES
jgi:hypothetical protein